MMIETFIAMAHYLAPRNDDDQIDRMHYLYTPNILIALSVLISFKQFGGRPLECMFPNKFPGSWEQYAENYCWSQDTYFVSPSEHVALIKSEERYAPERKLSYYQWVPFFLLLQAACFRLPSIFWNYLSKNSGLRIHEIVKIAMVPDNIDTDVKTRNVGILTRHMQNALRFQRRITRHGIEPHKRLKCLNLPYTAFYMTAMYLFTKAIYLLNVIVQLYAMNKFLETDKEGWYGLQVIKDLINGVEWGASGFFPRVRQVANIQRYSVQCVLVINIFNEKIFVLMWFWYMFLMLATVLSFAYWFLLMMLPFCGRSFVSQHLELSELPFDSKRDKKTVDKFVDHYLRTDGIFVLRMVSMHAGIIFGTDLVTNLWAKFNGIEEEVG